LRNELALQYHTESMTQLTSSDVKHVAKLANLPLTLAETKKLQKQLSAVVSYIDELNEVDVTDIQATSQTTGLENVFRDDEIDVTRVLSQDDALSATEKVHNGYFVVPMVLEEKKE
jgi:aspartyl-tRNA(Asn)/glutamyl-tRNA(Gln) amidotransferase subunit C